MATGILQQLNAGGILDSSIDRATTRSNLNNRMPNLSSRARLLETSLLPQEISGGQGAEEHFPRQVQSSSVQSVHRYSSEKASLPNLGADDANSISQVRDRSTRSLDSQPISPIHANPRIAAILRAGIEEDRPMSRESSNNIRRPRGNDMFGRKQLSDRLIGATSPGSDGLPSEESSPLHRTTKLRKGSLAAVAAPQRPKKEKKSKKHKSDKKERKRTKKLLKKVKKARKKYSAMKVQRILRSRWSNMSISPQAHSIGSNDSDEQGGGEAEDPRLTKAAIRIQSMCRAHIARVSTAVMQEAREAGVMVAINGTVQGKCGWYQDFDHQVYYFAVDGEGIWWEVVTEKKWKSYRSVRSQELVAVPLLIAKRGTEVGTNGAYASLVMESYNSNPKQTLLFERWFLDNGIFVKG